MPFDDLTQFLQDAADAGELERIASELDGNLQLAALTDQIVREFRDRSPVILCENVSGSSIPVVTNLLGNRRRFLRALGAESLDDVVQRFVSAWNPFSQQRDWKQGLTGSVFTDRDRHAPKQVRRGLCQQVIKLGRDLDLAALPIPHSWTGESGPALTSAAVLTSSPAGQITLEAIPVEVIDGETVQLHWNRAHHAHANWQIAAAEHRQLPVAIALGGDPLIAYTASLPLPPYIDPWQVAGLLRDAPCNLIRGRSVELNVPADAEWILEGYLDPDGETGSGTLADEQGLLRTRNNLPHVKLTALTHRANPILPASIHAFSFQERHVTMELTEKLLLALLGMTCPYVHDLHLPVWGGRQDVAVVSLKHTDAEQNRQLSHLLTGLPVGCKSRWIILVDQSVDLRDDAAIWREIALANRFQENPISGRPLLIDATHAAISQQPARAIPSESTLAAVRMRLAGQIETGAKAVAESAPGFSNSAAGETSDA